VGLGGGLYAHFLGIITVDVFYLDMTFITLSMLVIGGVSSLTGAVVGVAAVTAIVESLIQLEQGFPLGGVTIALPRGSEEIGLGIVMILILIFRPGGIMRGRDLPWLFGRGRNPAPQKPNGVARKGVVSDEGVR
jgi:branched-chain amino acid transport system permease protein